MFVGTPILRNNHNTKWWFNMFEPRWKVSSVKCGIQTAHMDKFVADIADLFTAYERSRFQSN